MQQQRDEQLRRLEEVQRLIAEAMVALDGIAGWAEHRGTIKGHLERARKKASELERVLHAAL
jgi:hypothetical protein